jgi:hypothetical protein
MKNFKITAAVTGGIVLGAGAVLGVQALHA